MKQPKLPRVTRVVTSEQMRALDAMATEKYGIPSLLLMESAGRAVFQVVADLLGDVHRKSVLVVCGPGNNGGDGFVAARHLHNAGAFPTIAYYGEREKAKGDALTNLEIAEKMRLDIETNRLDGKFWSQAKDEFALIIDALLGTGVAGKLREPYDQIIPLIKGCAEWNRIPVVAVDIPSGIDADSGALLGPAVEADVTVTFGFPKIGLVTYPGKSWVGRLAVADIGIPKNAWVQDWPKTCLLDADAIQMYVAQSRRPDSHKGDYGHLAVIAGSVGMTGAATLVAEGALRIGTGLVTLAVPESLNDIMEVKLTEAMTIPVPQGKARAFGMASLPKVLEVIEKRDAAVIGPGFGRDDDTIQFALELIAKLDKPAIVDADALYAISKDLSVLKKCKAPLVITPHPGEMATLLGTSVAEVQSNRLETARAFAKEHGVTVVLKGAATIVAGPEGDAWINTTGTPGMATGGTGDVLSGMIGGLLARHSSASWPKAAAQIAVYLHGRAGELAAEELGEAAMIASDVADCVPEATEEVRRKAVDEFWLGETPRALCLGDLGGPTKLSDIALDGPAGDEKPPE